MTEQNVPRPDGDIIKERTAAAQNYSQLEARERVRYPADGQVLGPEQQTEIQRIQLEKAGLIVKHNLLIGGATARLQVGWIFKLDQANRQFFNSEENPDVVVMPTGHLDSFPDGTILRVHGSAVGFLHDGSYVSGVPAEIRPMRE